MSGAKLTAAQSFALDIAINTGSVAAGTNVLKLSGGGQKVVKINGSTVLSLIKRGLLVHCYSTEGGLAGRVHESSIAGVNLREGAKP